MPPKPLKPPPPPTPEEKARAQRAFNRAHNTVEVAGKIGPVATKRRVVKQPTKVTPVAPGKSVVPVVSAETTTRALDLASIAVLKNDKLRALAMRLLKVQSNAARPEPSFRASEWSTYLKKMLDRCMVHNPPMIMLFEIAKMLNAFDKRCGKLSPMVLGRAIAHHGWIICATTRKTESSNPTKVYMPRLLGYDRICQIIDEQNLCKLPALTAEKFDGVLIEPFIPIPMTEPSKFIGGLAEEVDFVIDRRTVPRPTPMPDTSIQPVSAARNDRLVIPEILGKDGEVSLVAAMWTNDFNINTTPSTNNSGSSNNGGNGGNADNAVHTARQSSRVAELSDQLHAHKDTADCYTYDNLVAHVQKTYEIADTEIASDYVNDIISNLEDRGWNTKPIVIDGAYVMCVIYDEATYEEE